MGTDSAATQLGNGTGKLKIPAGEGQPVGAKKKTDPSKKKKEKKIVGECPVVNVQIQGKKTQAMLDTGSQITTITEEWARQHLKNLEERESFFKIRAVNGAEVPYSSLCTVDIELFERKFEETPVFITPLPSDPFMKERKRETPVLIGMNILEAIFDDSKGQIPEGLNLLRQEIQKSKREVKSMGRTAMVEHIPAYSIATVKIRSPTDCKSVMLASPLNQPLPKGLMMVPTLLSGQSQHRYVRIANLSAEDKILPEKLPVAWLEKVDEPREQTTSIMLQVNELIISPGRNDLIQSEQTANEEEEKKKKNAGMTFQTSNSMAQKKKRTSYSNF